MTFKQGDRVQKNPGDKGVVVSVPAYGAECKVGWDNPELGYGSIMVIRLESIDPSPAIKDLPDAQREIMLALADKRKTEGQHEAHDALRQHGYIWTDGSITPYGRWQCQQYHEWVKAGKPDDAPAEVEVKATPALEVNEAQESQIAETPDVIEKHTMGTLVLPAALGGDDLARNQEFAALKAKVDDLEAEVNAWREKANEKNNIIEALTKERDLLKGVNQDHMADLREKQGEIEGLRQEISESSIKHSALARWHDENVRTIADLKKTIEAQKQELADVKTKRLSIKPVASSVQRHLLTLQCKLNDEVGELRLEFLPAMEQPQTGLSEMVIPITSIGETAEEQLDAYDLQLAATALNFISGMSQQRKLKNVS